jgi:hypothetical protein
LSALDLAETAEWNKYIDAGIDNIIEVFDDTMSGQITLK